MRYTIAAFLLFNAICAAAPPNRISRPIDNRKSRVLAGGVHRLAQPQFDKGAIDASTMLPHMVLMVRPTAIQRAELEELVANQQNPSSPLFHKWLTPEEFGNRFGLSASDHSKVIGWLAGEGFEVTESARARNWIAFRGTAGQVAKTLHTRIHRYEVDGATHIANAEEPAVPEALAEVVDGFLELNDFPMKSFAVPVPLFTSGTSHFLSPEDFATIYNITPLYKAGLDGTGTSIAVVGQSQLSLTDLRAFRTRFGLPANDPKMILYGGADPGVTGSQIEGHLDVEWANAIAPKAAINYIYGANAFTAVVAAVNSNLSPIITISYGGCELDFTSAFYRSVAQQANAQGITILASSGDSGSACDRQGSVSSSRGQSAHFPTVLPEITSVGGTQFVEGTGTYWSTANSPNFGSALSYIPEAAWNETSGINGLLAGGGGVSAVHPMPAWQQGFGVPTDGMRRYPDVALTAAAHDAYLITHQGQLGGVAGTSASTPALAGVVALLNQSQVFKGLQRQPGLGNINPQLYRLAQIAPSAFHDITAGDIVVPCAQGAPDCLTGSFGYEAAPGFDMATGLGSIDAEQLVTQWNAASSGVTVSLVLSTTRAAVNDMVDATALVSGVNGTPTGRVEFNANGVSLGSAVLVSRGIQGQAADLSFPAYRLGVGASVVAATYSGDFAFSSGGATRNVSVTAGSGASAIVVSAPDTVWPTFPDAQGLGWQTIIQLREVAGVPSIVTGFSIDGQTQPLTKYFPTPNIPANGTLNVNVAFRDLATPAVRTFVITGIDSNGQTWSRSATVNYSGQPSGVGFLVTATPLTVTRNTADPACEWPVQVNIDELDGFGTTISGLFAGSFSLTSDISSIFGTSRLSPWGSLQGVVCFNGITSTASSYIEVDGSNGFAQEVSVSFAGPTVAPGKVTTSRANVSLIAAGTAKNAQTTLAVNTTDKTQAWTVSVYPANRMAGWLTVSPLSGTGPAQITLSANGAGYGPGAYRASIVIQSQNAQPQSITVPVMFVLGGATSGMAITGIGNAFSASDKGAPGMLLSIYGKNLAKEPVEAAVISPKPYELGGVSAVVNGIAAPILAVSPTQVNIQIPYEVGAGPAVLGLNNNGEIAGFAFQVAPAAPGILTDADGMVAPQATAQIGKIATLLLTGAGDLVGLPRTAFSTSPTASLANGFKPALPVSLTVAGVPAFVQTAATAPGQVGVLQVNFIVPDSTPTGTQPLVVTIGGASATAKVVVE
jgi:uncharacterized protein (TIGR03437 family)